MLKVLRSYRAFLAVQQVVRINILGVASCFVSFPDMWHGGTNYPRISRTGVPKRGDVGITVTPGFIACRWAIHVVALWSGWEVFPWGFPLCSLVPSSSAAGPIKGGLLCAGQGIVQLLSNPTWQKVL